MSKVATPPPPPLRSLTAVLPWASWRMRAVLLTHLELMPSRHARLWTQMAGTKLSARGRGRAGRSPPSRTTWKSSGPLDWFVLQLLQQRSCRTLLPQQVVLLPLS
jgi:hypothetical protein